MTLCCVDTGELRRRRSAFPYAVFHVPSSSEIAVAVEADLGVVVLAPPAVPVDAIVDWMSANHADLAARHRHTVQRQAWGQRPLELRSGARHLYLGRQLQLDIARGDYAVGLRGGRLVVQLPREVRRADVEAEVASLIYLFYRARTAHHVLDRIAALARKVGVRVPRVCVLPLESAWGACHPEQPLVFFDPRIIQAPLGVLDYAIVHELAHLRRRAHDARHHALIAGVIPDHAARHMVLERLELAMRRLPAVEPTLEQLARNKRLRRRRIQIWAPAQAKH